MVAIKVTEGAGEMNVTEVGGVMNVTEGAGENVKGEDVLGEMRDVLQRKKNFDYPTSQFTVHLER